MVVWFFFYSCLSRKPLLITSLSKDVVLILSDLKFVYQKKKNCSRLQCRLHSTIVLEGEPLFPHLRKKYFSGRGQYTEQ